MHKRCRKPITAAVSKWPAVSSPSMDKWTCYLLRFGPEWLQETPKFYRSVIGIKRLSFGSPKQPYDRILVITYANMAAASRETVS